jgi:protein-disulfide isomerase
MPPDHFSRIFCYNPGSYAAEEIRHCFERETDLKFLSALAPLLLMGFLAAGCSESEAPKAAKLPKEEVEKLLRDYILHNPEVILKSVRDHQAKQQANKTARAKKQLEDKQDELTRSPGSPVAGNPGGDVTVVEFFDYRCGYCRKSFPALLELERTDPKVRIVFKEFPILGPQSLFAARAALAARAQGKYFALHKAMMSGRVPISEKGIMAAVKSLGIDADKLKKDMDAPAVAAELRQNNQLAAALGVRGTPAFIVGKQLSPGAATIARLRQLVRQARSGAPVIRLREGGSSRPGG